MLNPNPLHTLWHTPIGLHNFSQASAVNDVLVRVFKTMRATDSAAVVPTQAFYASQDDLLQRIKLGEWDQLVRFIVGSVSQTVMLANQGAWPQGKPGFNIAVRGIWFQISNQGCHHDVHTHGNCSWSGVYCLQVDSSDLRSAHPVYGSNNGVTRFYGPYFHSLAGAASDFGNAYLQHSHIDIEPIPGQLVVFPSWLPHQAMPYSGQEDRIIVSFNMSVHAANQSDQVHGYAHV
jgi:uncharacterized protein (TIGR02466 family)